MSARRDILFEIGTEEMPAKGLQALAAALESQLVRALTGAGLSVGETQIYATPRRLAVIVKQVDNVQPEQLIERKGPSLSAAFDAKGQPTKAAEGFARSCGVTDVAALGQCKSAEGAWLMFRQQTPGKMLKELLPTLAKAAVAGLPLTKTMRWGSHPDAFIRPVHWITLLCGEELVHAEVLGIASGRSTHGHRFYHPTAIALQSPAEYDSVLYTQGKVIADFYVRRESIRQNTISVAAKWQGHALVEEALLDEVTGLVEWPVVLLANFETRFLAVPAEVLIAVMQGHQKCFPVVNDKGELLPHFITVSNIESKNEQQVIIGNERVMRARLSDAAFFYEQDRKQPLENYLERLKTMVFQRHLGNFYDRAERLAHLAKLIATKVTLTQPKQAYRAGFLCKADLATALVGEFPELQGLLGYYYARADGEAENVTRAIRDHYLPRSATDKLPKTLTGCAVALADRLDTLVGLFIAGQPPTGDSDPFGLRRAALGLLRILIAKRLEANLPELIHATINGYTQHLSNQNVVQDVHTFILERLRAWYFDQQIAGDTLNAVLAVACDDPLDIDRRVRAVNIFRREPNAVALAAANKRVSNLLQKSAIEVQEADRMMEIDVELLSDGAELDLYNALMEKVMLRDEQKSHEKVHDENYYARWLQELATLREPIDNFFDKVMVMAEDNVVRCNRLALLATLRQLFLSVADISLLQT